jgi:hypothetical protein
LTSPSFEVLLAQLADGDVRFVVVGGLALGALGGWSAGRRTDVVHGLEGVPRYAELRAEAIDVEIDDVTVAICALEHLRTMKRIAGRPRDLVDLDAAQPG